MKPVASPQELAHKYPIPSYKKDMITQSRAAIRHCLAGTPTRLIVIVGPCSLDDSVLDDGSNSIVNYARRLIALRAKSVAIHQRLQLVLRCPPVKPRTAGGWSGLEQDSLEGAYALLSRLASLDIPLAIEVLAERHYAYYGDLISLAWVGARNVCDTGIRQAASYHSEIPTLFKNVDHPNGLEAAMAARQTAEKSHRTLITGSDGRLYQISQTVGNPRCGVIFRGWENITLAEFEATILNSSQRLVVDCGHANSSAFDSAGEKSVKGQMACLQRVGQLIRDGAPISGVMIESYLRSGSDQITPGRSRTDPCIDWYHSQNLLEELACMVPQPYPG